MTPEDRRWLIEHLEQRIEKLETKIDTLHDRLAGFVTWKGLGAVVTISATVITVVWMVTGAR